MNHKRSANVEAKSTHSPLLKISKIECELGMDELQEPANSTVIQESKIILESESVAASSSSTAIVSNAPPPLPAAAQPTLETGVYLNKIDLLGAEANEKALSLFDLIQRIRPIASIHFNFSIDPTWVLKQYSRRLREYPISFIAGQNHLSVLREECKRWTNVQTAGAPLPITYGTHHTKLSLFESENAIHVVVSTANLVQEDWALKTQMFFYCRANFGGSPSQKEQPFRDDLLEYLRMAYPKKTGKAFELVSYWTERIVGGNADFSYIQGRIVASVPGRYFKPNADINKFGHMRLREILNKKLTREELQSTVTFIAQFSSIGSLGPKPDSWLCDEFLISLSGGISSATSDNLKLIYPSVENVRNSLEGYAAGLSLPYRSDVHKKQLYLRKFLHQWKSEKFLRTLAMPHVKTYAGLDGKGNPHWRLLTSANLSGAAWGKLEKGGTQLLIRSYELGVIIFTKDCRHLDHNLILPYDLPLTKYEQKDEPFNVDLLYPKLPSDSFGFRGAGEVAASRS